MKDSTSSDIPAFHASEEEAEKFNLDSHLVKLLLHEPFFSHLLRKMNKEKTIAISTAGVIAKDDTLYLLWNPRFLAALESIHVRGLLKHECYHLIFNHCTGRRQDPPLLWNWATDLAINSLISLNELPEMGLVPGREIDLSHIKDAESLKKWKKISEFIRGLPTKKSSEWYMEKLKSEKEISKMIQESSGQGEGVPSLDDHEGWGGLSDEEKQVMEGKIKNALSEAVKNCDRTGQWGSVSAQTQKRLRKMVSNAVDWKKVLHNFCGRSQRLNKARTHKKINRKYPYIHPGIKKGHSANLAVFIDQSGSVSDSDLELFFGVLNSFGRITSFTIFPFDTSVDEKNSMKWSRGKKLPPKRTRYGGTSFHAVEAYMKKNGAEFDGHIILTDGEASDPGRSAKRRCWVLLPGQKLYFDPHSSDIVVKMKRGA
jgi:predicted metal-dependent peptidase